MGSIWKKKNMKVVKDRTKTKKEKATHLGKESGPKLRNAFQVWGRRERGGGKGGGGGCSDKSVVIFIFIFFLMLCT